MRSDPFEAIGRNRVSLSVLTTPSDDNGLGHVFGGVVFSLMERAAYIAASRHVGMTCVARGMGDVEFQVAIEIGEVLHVVAEVLVAAHTSVLVQVDAYAERVVEGELRHTNSCLATMVALGSDGRPVAVPGRRPASRESRVAVLRGLAAKEILDRARHAVTEAFEEIATLDDATLEGRLASMGID
ncbi:MAG TPA: acyl-CoA thioesterase [Fimbriimonadaceae bacterium]|nr:acyl-CoA thioesterase [Fimbriimonadaceae bacterium]HRJ96162.1 acyl-CoA thioesterase [Fimbriimonadaceae bacterium]